MNELAHELFSISKYATDLEFLHYKISDWITELEKIVARLKDTTSENERKSAKIKFRSTSKMIKRFMEEYKELAEGFCEEVLFEAFVANGRTLQVARRWTKQIFEIEEEDVMDSLQSTYGRLDAVEMAFRKIESPVAEGSSTTPQLANGAEREDKKNTEVMMEPEIGAELVPVDVLKKLSLQRRNLLRQQARMLELRDQIDACDTSSGDDATRLEIDDAVGKIQVDVKRLRDNSLAFDEVALTHALIEKRGMNRFMAEMAARTLVGEHWRILSRVEVSVQDVRKGIRRRV